MLVADGDRTAFNECRKLRQCRGSLGSCFALSYEIDDTLLHSSVSDDGNTLLYSKPTVLCSFELFQLNQVEPPKVLNWALFSGVVRP